MANATLTCQHRRPRRQLSQLHKRLLPSFFYPIAGDVLLIDPKGGLRDAQIQDLCDAAYRDKHHEHAGCAPPRMKKPDIRDGVANQC
jgi:hypothetical protein